ncbi:carboxymuconolactone decarboxylase family protein [Pseudonocardia humida]|uniref:Carboxymuconolactone decarboxylase family protein n=1 Tax=Pseudonocardia humida TaxID=2800819 RepID=A0ABT0ZZT9_9PSEU|nr:carboxymuconolactone decarboxylase family protein [Pseudonocardia humida]MCO1656257.1 carboxymuconolactone decarboxylase family protein [Pseudonocardia humida]
MARVRYLTAETAPPAVASTVGKMPPLHVFQMLAHAETAYRPWLRYGGAILSDLALDPLLRELVILQVGRLAARYEWEQHVPIAKAAGATDEQLAALDRGELDPFDAAQRATLVFTRAFVRDGEVTDEEYAALSAELSEREIVEIALTAGHYLGLARVMTALRIDPDPAVGPEGLPAARL